MNIGFDLDKIFVDYPPLIPDRVIDGLYKKRSKGKLLYRIPSRPEQLIRKASHLPLFRPHIKKNMAFLQSIDRSNNTLYLISSRFQFLKPETEKLAKRLGFSDIFTHMYFNYENKQPHEFKSKVIRQLKLDAYIDDDFPLLKYIAKENKKTQFYWLRKKGGAEKLTRNITAISALSDILTLYKKL